MIAARSFPLGVVGDSFLDFDDDDGEGLAFLGLEVGVFVGVGESWSGVEGDSIWSD